MTMKTLLTEKQYELKVTQDNLAYVLAEIEVTLERGWGWTPLSELNAHASKLQSDVERLEIEVICEDVLNNLGESEADQLVEDMFAMHCDDGSIECTLDFDMVG